MGHCQNRLVWLKKRRRKERSWTHCANNVCFEPLLALICMLKQQLSCRKGFLITRKPPGELQFYIHMLQHTLSETQYDWRKIEPVTMKANFIHFWCVESEFIVKNEFHNWTSELGCIWHIFGKFGSFQALQHWQQPAAANKKCQIHPNSDVQ